MASSHHCIRGCEGPGPRSIMRVVGVMQSLQNSSSLLLHKLSSGQSLSWAHQGAPDDGERSFVSLQALSASLLLEQVCDPQGIGVCVCSILQWPSHATTEDLHAPAGQNIPFSARQQAKPGLEAPLRFLRQPHRNLESLQEDAPAAGQPPLRCQPVLPELLPLPSPGTCRRRMHPLVGSWSLRCSDRVLLRTPVSRGNARA